MLTRKVRSIGTTIGKTNTARKKIGDNYIRKTNEKVYQLLKEPKIGKTGAMARIPRKNVKRLCGNNNNMERTRLHNKKRKPKKDMERSRTGRLKKKE